MKSNVLLIILTIIVSVAFYLLYNNQSNQLKKISNSILEIEKSLLSIKSSENSIISNNYKENNLIANNTINFADSLVKLMDIRINEEILDSFYIELEEAIIILEDEVEDTLCYGLNNQYRIINFYNNRIRIKNISKPGSELISEGDTLYYDNLKYLVSSINSKDQYIYLYNLTDNKNCYFFKN